MVYGGKSWPLVRSMVLFQFRGCPVLGLICLSLDFDPFEPCSSGGGGGGGLFPAPLVLSFLLCFLDLLLLDLDLLLDFDPKKLFALELSSESESEELDEPPSGSPFPDSNAILFLCPFLPPPYRGAGQAR